VTVLYSFCIYITRRKRLNDRCLALSRRVTFPHKTPFVSMRVCVCVCRVDGKDTDGLQGGSPRWLCRLSPRREQRWLHGVHVNTAHSGVDQHHRLHAVDGLSHIISTKYFRVYLFCLGPISSETPCRTTAKFCTQTRTDHVQNIYWVFVYKGVVVTKKMTYFKKVPVCRPTASRRWRLGRLAG